MFDITQLASNIRAFRRRKGLTQGEVANELFVSPQSISKWECGEAIPDLVKLCGLAKIFAVSLDELVGETNQQAVQMIAVDGNGSRSEFLLFNSNGDILHRKVLAGTNPNFCGLDAVINILQKGIDEMLRIQPNVKGVFIGSSGFLTSGNADAARDALKRIYPRLSIKCNSNICNAIIAVGEEESCVVSTCGTGNIVFGYKQGEITRLGGGYGGLFERGGGSFGIGREAFRIALEEEDKKGEVSLITKLLEEKFGDKIFNCLYQIYNQESVYAYVASFASIVFQAYEQGDEVAKKILHDTAEYSANLIHQAFESYDTPEKTVVLMGGLCRNEVFLNLLREKIRSDLTIKLPEYPPVYGACLLCCRLCGVSSDALTERFFEQYNQVLKEEQ